MSNLLPVQKTKFVKNEEIQKEWILVDAENQVLGRVASRIAHIIMGKHKPTYAPHQDIGDFVVVINAGKIRVTGNKMEDKVYYTHTLHPGGLRTLHLKQRMEKSPTYALQMAVRRMLPKGAMGRKLLGHLKVYADDKHNHAAQKPKHWEVTYK